MIAQCAPFSKSESWKYRQTQKRFGFPDPYPVAVWKQFLDIRIRLQLTILPDIQLVNWIVIISVMNWKLLWRGARRQVAPLASFYTTIL